MGIIGTVIKVQDNSVIVSLYDGAKMEILKAAITDVQASAEDKARKLSRLATHANDRFCPPLQIKKAGP